MGERKRARKSPPAKKGNSRKEEKKKRVPLLGVGKTIVGSLLFFGVCILACPFQRFLRFVLICFFFPSSSTKGHRKYLPFIQGKISEPSASGLFGR